MARQAYAQGQYKQAVVICDQLASRLGARDDLLNIKAVSLLALGKVELAEKSIRQALKINPRVAGVHLNAAGIYKALSQNKLVKRHAMEAVRLAPREAAVLYQAALLCRDCGDYSQSLRIIERCLQLHPGFSQAWHLKGSALIDLGDMESAQAALERSIALEPGNVRALSSLVKIRGDKLDNAATVAQLEHIRFKGASPTDRASASFVLGNLCRRDGQHDVAFNLYLEANALVAANRPFNLEAWTQKVTHVRQTSAMPGALTSTQGSSGANLVFIVGMPRSGTTLCEQVLSANSGVLACGELSAMEHLEQGFQRMGNDPYQAVKNRKDFEQAAAQYLSVLPRGFQKFELVTDKAPMNFERIGFIHLVFPRARFLYCVRHPLDTILSCFMQDFQSGMNFAFKLDQMTKVYIAHVGLMKHWIKLLPGQIHVVDYEKYIEDQEAETRKITEFLQLGFEPAMLTPHKQERAVTTASNLQVRQAVYRSSIGRWKHYQRHLGSVISLLQDEGLLDAELNSLL